MDNPPDFSILVVGCGRVGTTLAKLFTQTGRINTLFLYDNNPKSAAEAIALIPGANIVENLSEAAGSDIVLIATPDQYIQASCMDLLDHKVIGTNSIVFHCSGCAGSELLESARIFGARVASIHPIKSFSSPQSASKSFAGTWCAYEGEESALNVLLDLFRQMGAKLFHVNPENKALYHAAAVLSCNYLVTLVDIAKRAYQQAGVNEQTAMELMEPLVRGTVDNLFSSDAKSALTGPIARGDLSTVSVHTEAIAQWDCNIESIYRTLGIETCSIARRAGLDKEKVDELLRLLSPKH